MKLGDFVDMYHEFVRYHNLFPTAEYEFPCMFSHKDRLEACECYRCNGYYVNMM